MHWNGWRLPRPAAREEDGPNPGKAAVLVCCAARHRVTTLAKRACADWREMRGGAEHRWLMGRVTLMTHPRGKKVEDTTTCMVKKKKLGG